jgi:Ser/Thr protein kinase RdoA (MazF antagonist)
MARDENRITAGEMRRVLEPWRMRAMFTRPGGGTANASVVIVTNRGQFFLKRRNPRYCDPDQLSYDHSVLHGLAQAGLPVPHVVRTPEGSRWLRLGEQVYEMFQFIDGQDFNPNSPEEIAAAGTALGTFHRASVRLHPSGKKDWPRYFDPKVSHERLVAVRQRLREGNAGDLGSFTPEQVDKTLAYLMAQAKACTKNLPTRAYESLPHTIVHGDWNSANLRFRDHQVVGITDFDWVGHQPRLLDVADGLIYFGATRENNLDGGDIWSLTQPFTFQWDRMALFLEAYRALVPLADAEMQVLPDFLRQRCLYIRVDAMARKVPEADQLRFVVTGVEEPLQWIAANEEKLRSGRWEG